MFIVTLFIIVRTRKLPSCPLTDCWIKILWYGIYMCIYIVEYNSTIQINEFKPVLVRWLNLELIIQSEVSKKEKNKNHLLTYIYEI